MAEAQGVRVWSERVSGIEDLPDGLRTMLRQGVDAVWLPPDPVLINARSFSIFREFSRSNDVPLYVPASSLLDRGATASISCGIDEIGRMAAQLARAVQSGDVPSEVVYPERVLFRVNKDAAQNVGLEIDRDSLKVNGQSK